MTIKQLANELVTCFLKEGFNVQIYEAYSTSSVYIKLDYGLSNSIRISDHKGKKHLRYRFNVLINETGYRTKVQGGIERRYYGTDKISKLISDIIKFRDSKIQYYGGLDEYTNKKLYYKNLCSGNKGFWSSAKEVTLKEV